MVAALLCMLIKQRLVIEILSVAAAALALLGSIQIAFRVAAHGTYAPFPLVSVDALGAIVMLIIAGVGFVVTVYSVAYLRRETAKGIIGLTRTRQYFILLDLFLAAMFLAVATSNPIVTWIGIEATTLSTAFLISFYNKPSAMEGAWKYLIINSVGLLLGFLGTLLFLTSLQAASEHTLITWSSLLANASSLDPFVAKIAFIFVFIGYGVKAGFAPLHTWLPDAHSKAPAPISALLSGVLLNVAFFTILKFKIITGASVGDEFASTIFVGFGLLSIAVAAMIIFVQRSYKRLLAYSSIENMGIMALGFGFGGLGAFAAVLHMLYHSFIKSALFLLSGNFLLAFSSSKIKNVRGALSVIPLTSVLFLVGIFAIAGTPPFGMFLTKLTVLSSGMGLHLVVVVVALLLFAIVFMGLFKHASAMLFGEKPEDINKEKESVWLVLPPIVLLAAALYFSIHTPDVLRTLVDRAVTLYANV